MDAGLTECNLSAVDGTPEGNTESVEQRGHFNSRNSSRYDPTTKSQRL